MKKLGCITIGAIGFWGYAQVALAGPILAQAVADPGLGTVGNVAIPGSIGGLVFFLAYSLREVYKQLADERVASANRITEECKQFAIATQQIYDSNKADLQRTYTEMQELVRQTNARQDATHERLITLILSILPKTDTGGTHG